MGDMMDCGSTNLSTLNILLEIYISFDPFHGATIQELAKKFGEDEKIIQSYLDLLLEKEVIYQPKSILFGKSYRYRMKPEFEFNIVGALDKLRE